MTTFQRAIVLLAGPLALTSALTASAATASAASEKDFAPDRFCYTAILPFPAAEPPETNFLYCYDFGSSWE
ncbi:hypothetical protein [Thermomonospora cellulosilytica]|uniref:Uncharacterized protein n=1 Tax=Thermomonospora cellulosilytica TaxID=1411118 RepID=A0A7W3MUZ1_9ACTN|nr:hypothetical protein [Thermomonospora cellulosilytica]MBA9002349.1 hypothetical protein [Thermomonospora cellulosilytica]